jgi:hypothetical protein
MKISHSAIDFHGVGVRVLDLPEAAAPLRRVKAISPAEFLRVIAEQ